MGRLRRRRGRRHADRHSHAGRLPRTAGPIAEVYDANGAVPTVRNLSVGGHTWNVYRGSNGSNAVFSFIRTNTSSGTVDILAILNWLRTNGWWGDVTVGEVQFGFELTGTAGQSAFTTNSFALTAS